MQFGEHFITYAGLLMRASFRDALLQCREKNKKDQNVHETKNNIMRVGGTQVITSADDQNDREAHSTPTTHHRPMRKEFLSQYSRSPSVQNLDNMSVVRNRIAQINVNGFDTPLSRSTSQARTEKYLAPPVLEHNGTAKRPIGYHRSNSSKIKRLPDPRDDSSVVDLNRNVSSSMQPMQSERKAVESPRTVNKDSPSPYMHHPRSEWSPSQYVTTPATTTYTQFQSNENPVHPLVALIEDVATRQYEKTAGLGHQIKSLQDNMHSIANDVQLLISSEDSASIKQLIHSLSGKLKNLATLQEFSRIDEKLSAIQLVALKDENLKSNAVESFNEKELSRKDVEPDFDVHGKLEEIISLIRKYASKGNEDGATQIISDVPRSERDSQNNHDPNRLATNNAYDTQVYVSVECFIGFI